MQSHVGFVTRQAPGTQVAEICVFRLGSVAVIAR